MKARIPEENLPKEEVISAKSEEEALPILIAKEEDGSETYLVQTKDYKFAQFLAIVQNRCTLELINRILEEGISEEADKKGIDNLIHFCDLLYLWSKKAMDIDDDILKILKGEPANESDSN